MRFLLPFIVIGALLASQIVLASGIPLSVPMASGSPSSPILRLCANRFEQRRALRLFRTRRRANCQPGLSLSVSSSVSTASSLSSSSSASSSSSSSFDPMTDTQAQSQFLLLGETGPMLGAAKIFLEVEPLHLRSITVNLSIAMSTVQSLLLYDDQRHLLGRATLDPTASMNRSYTLALPIARLTIGKREERTIYVRPVLLSKDAGGLSNQLVQISSIVTKGTGEWSNQAYMSQATGTNTYPLFQTARSTITTVINAGSATSRLLLGTNQVVGSFTIAGRRSDSTAHLDITTLVFTIQQTGGVGITNPTLSTEGINEKFPCIANATAIACSGIPDSYGSATDGPRTFTVYGTVAATDALHASLQLAINNLGDSLHAGDITWNDGTNSFSRVALPSGVSSVNGTRFQY